jgi:L-lactate dehydrogenase complex protein LldG
VSDARAQILNRIRVALRTSTESAPVAPPKPIFPPIADPLSRLVDEFQANRIECFQVNDTQQVSDALARALSKSPRGRIYAEDTPLIRELTGKTDREVIWSTSGPAPKDAQVSITHCEALIAQTGSILLSSRNGGRTGSIVPPCHIVLASERQVVATLEQALHAASVLAQTQSFVGVITGPSRTADIEKIIVHGAHGPRRVMVILHPLTLSLPHRLHVGNA